METKEGFALPPVISWLITLFCFILNILTLLAAMLSFSFLLISLLPLGIGEQWLPGPCPFLLILGLVPVHRRHTHVWLLNDRVLYENCEFLNQWKHISSWIPKRHNKVKIFKISHIFMLFYEYFSKCFYLFLLLSSQFHQGSLSGLYSPDFTN